MSGNIPPVADKAFQKLNVGQLFLGFAWSLLYTNITHKVFAAEQSVLAFPIAIVKTVYTAVSVIFIVGLVHTFWGFNERILDLEDVTGPGVTLDRFWPALTMSLGRAGYVVGLVFFFIITTHVLFPGSNLNLYETVFTAAIWPVWIVSVFVAVFRGL